MTGRPIYESEHDFGWASVPLFFNGVFVEQHVIPEGDLRLHLMGPKCWCNPKQDGSSIIHNSADNRELYERGERAPH
jgi:hypothetical protein